MAQQFDVSLKSLFRRSNGIFAETVFGSPVAEWLNVELPEIRNLRVDLLGRDIEGRLHHLELESANHPVTPRRIAEYHLALHKLLDEDVDMVVLYVGREPLRMPAVFQTRSMRFQFRMIDAREFDGEALIASEDLGDNMLALLTPFDRERVLQRVEQKLGALPRGEREEAARLFVLLSGLRGLARLVAERFRMIDIMENEVLGPAVLKGEATVLLAQLEDCFGPLPSWVYEKFEGATESQILAWAKRLRRADSLESVFA